VRLEHIEALLAELMSSKRPRRRRPRKHNHSVSRRNTRKKTKL
jgi:hypothetical protein